jgi:hypothetical protein
MTQPTQNSGHKWVMDYPNVPLGHCMCGYGRTFGENGIDPEQYAAHVASVAQPQEVPAKQQLTGQVTPGKWQSHSLHPTQPASAAKPAEDGLEARLMEILYMDANREAQARNLAAFIRTHQVARERELREKLERLAVQLRERAVQSREEAGRIRRTVYVATDAESNCMVRAELWDNLDAELRALLASHWPAPAPEEHVCHDCERMVSNETRPAEPPASKGGKA